VRAQSRLEECRPVERADRQRVGASHVAGEAEGLAPALESDLDREEVNGIKIFFGGRAGEEICEVCVNGRVSSAATAALAELPWPRLPVPAFCRTFVLLAHRENPAGSTGVTSVEKA
jgi:hypothetical protein